jgi:hypothetical protein
MKAIIRGLGMWIYSRRSMPLRPSVMMPAASTLRLIPHTTSPVLFASIMIRCLLKPLLLLLQLPMDCLQTLPRQTLVSL